MKKLHFHPNYNSINEDLLKVLNDFDTQGEYVVKEERNTIKKVMLNGETINIKKFKKPSIFNAIIYRYFRKSKARRSFEFAERLISADLLTPFPIAYVEIRSLLFLKDSYYISKHINYDFDFRTLIHNPKFEDRKNILEQFAYFTFRLHENGVNFLDHSPGNTLIIRKADQIYDFYLIDLNRMVFKRMDFKDRMYNFRRLWLSKTMIKILSAKYAELFNRPYTETYELMLKHSRSFQKKVNVKKLRKRKWKALFS